MKNFINIKNPYFWGFLALIFITLFLRFSDLGYSHFYGDEVKAIYWNKAVSAKEFIFSQRKGPVQFFVAWGVETFSGGYDAFLMRLPFAIAGTFAVLAFYFLMREFFQSKRVVFLATFLFSINGFFVAFGRTVQYQSFLLLFGLLGVLFAFKAEKSLSKGNLFSAISGILIGLGFLSHYDAVFYLIPVLLVLAKDKKLLKYFLIPAFLVSASFYLPYLLGNYFTQNTTGYLSRRLGDNFSLLDSFYIYSVYNPFVLSLPLLVISPFLFKFIENISLRKILFIWFLIPFFVFEFIFKDSGTHIMHYVLPLLIVMAVFLDKILSLGKLYASFVYLTLFGFLYVSIVNFVPAFEADYPFRHGVLANSSRSLYLYGFPYNRAWDEAGEYLKSVEARSYYTNDNIAFTEFYTPGIAPKRVEPDYYVDVKFNQVFQENEDPAVFGRYEYVKIYDSKVTGRMKIYQRGREIVL